MLKIFLAILFPVLFIKDCCKLITKFRNKSICLFPNTATLKLFRIKWWNNHLFFCLNSHAIWGNQVQSEVNWCKLIFEKCEFNLFLVFYSTLSRWRLRVRVSLGVQIQWIINNECKLLFFYLNLNIIKKNHKNLLKKLFIISYC